MVIFPLAPDQTIAQMWSNGARGGHKIIKHKVIKSCGALRRINNANVSNLIQIITALCNNLDHLRLTR